MDNATQLANQNNGLTQAKRKLEGTINTMQEEAEDLENEAKNADDRAKKAAIEVREDSTRRVDSVTEGPTLLFLWISKGGGVIFSVKWDKYCTSSYWLLAASFLQTIWFLAASFLLTICKKILSLL